MSSKFLQKWPPYLSTQCSLFLSHVIWMLCIMTDTTGALQAKQASFLPSTVCVQYPLTHSPLRSAQDQLRVVATSSPGNDLGRAACVAPGILPLADATFDAVGLCRSAQTIFWQIQMRLILSVYLLDLLRKIYRRFVSTWFSPLATQMQCRLHGANCLTADVQRQKWHW